MNQEIRENKMVYGCKIWNVHPLGTLCDPCLRRVGYVGARDDGERV